MMIRHWHWLVGKVDSWMYWSIRNLRYFFCGSDNICIIVHVWIGIRSWLVIIKSGLQTIFAHLSACYMVCEGFSSTWLRARLCKPRFLNMCALLWCAAKRTSEVVGSVEEATIYYLYLGMIYFTRYCDDRRKTSCVSIFATLEQTTCFCHFHWYLNVSMSWPRTTF